jgi:hypothetical protein
MSSKKDLVGESSTDFGDDYSQNDGVFRIEYVLLLAERVEIGLYTK